MLDVVDALDHRPLEAGYHIDRLRREGALLAESAARAGLGAAVPACPGWQVRDLLAHVGYVHRWATRYVAERHTAWIDRLSEDEILAGKPADDALPGWFADGHAALARALAQADPGLTCWTFLPAPSPLAFWARRQAHETTVHRIDAQQAAAAQGNGQVATGEADLPARFAVDGIDELIMGFLGRDAERGPWRCPPGVLGVHAAGGEGGVTHWRVVSGQDRGTVARGEGPADCDVTGPAAELYLLLWNRLPATGLEVRGDSGLLAAFGEAVRVRWA
jgi:uncharacterized protein (TIGR03083 family)